MMIRLFAIFIIQFVRDLRIAALVTNNNQILVYNVSLPIFLLTI